MCCAFISNCKPLQLLGSLGSVSSVDSDGWFLLPPGVGELTISSIWHLAFTGSWLCLLSVLRANTDAG